jgi:hypothetical protein
MRAGSVWCKLTRTLCGNVMSASTALETSTPERKPPRKALVTVEIINLAFLSSIAWSRPHGHQLSVLLVAWPWGRQKLPQGLAMAAPWPPRMLQAIGSSIILCVLLVDVVLALQTGASAERGEVKVMGRSDTGEVAPRILRR